MKTSLYERDFYEWTHRTARLLREGRVNEADLDRVAEEIEDMGKRDRREVHNRLRVLLVHLLKWQLQPDRRGSSWRATIDEQRDALELVLRDSPSLRPYAAEALEEIYAAAGRNALAETGVQASLPRECPFRLEEVLDPGFLPG